MPFLQEKQMFAGREGEWIYIIVDIEVYIVESVCFLFLIW